MFDNLAIVDVETSGGSAQYDRVIEIGILCIRSGRVERKFNSLVNPGVHIPPEITMITGIHQKELEYAPTFDSIKEEIAQLLEGNVFVAHNARFDYSFLKSEFARSGITFSSRQLCTVKLSRMLFPQFRHHNLDSLIERHHIACGSRHRALGDATAVWEFLKHVRSTFGDTTLESYIGKVTREFTLPSTISRHDIHGIPESPGVYIFYNADGTPIYIGKSIHLKDRILSHFSDVTHNSKEAKIFQSIASFEVIRTQGELGALLTESKLIKEHKPLYNRMLRDARQVCVAYRERTSDGYFTVSLQRVREIRPDTLGRILAVFSSSKKAKSYLTELVATHMLCKKLLTLEKSGGSCFGFQLHTCAGACIGKELPVRYNLRFTEAFSKTKIQAWPFPAAVIIREGDVGHVVFQWCYLGVIVDGALSEYGSGKPAVFDYDNYKILSRYMRERSHEYSISPLTSEETAGLLSDASGEPVDVTA